MFCPAQDVESNRFPLDLPYTLSVYLLLSLLSISLQTVALSHLSFAFIPLCPLCLPACPVVSVIS